jgi:hypothetical protein
MSHLLKHLTVCSIFLLVTFVFSQETPMRALALDPPIYHLDAADLEGYMSQVCASGANTVALNAGRLDWTFFPWDKNSERWSSDVKDTRRDFVAETLTRLKTCNSVNHVSLIVDVFAPRYIADFPEAAAITADGERLEYQVSSVELAEGEFGEELLEMLEYLAATYPVDSISLTELFYYEEGYGPEDLTSYQEFTGREDWPRDEADEIDINAPSVGAWRSALVARFIGRAADVVQEHGKELIVDVRVPWGGLENRSRKYGQDFDLLLEAADRLVLWVYFDLDGYSPAYVQDIATAYAKYGPERMILSFGLWGQNDDVLAPAALQKALNEAQRSALQSVWITPSSFLTEEHWQVLEASWSRE